MNVHLMPNEKFAKKFIEFIDGYYEENSNFVYVYGFGEKYEHVESQNASYISTFDEVDLSLISDSDKLFIHGFYNTRLIRYLHKIYNQFHNNQLVLIAWGGDIYNDRIYLHEHKFDIITRYHEILKKSIIQKTNIFMTFACADIDVIKKYYGGNGKQFDCLYPSNADKSLLDDLRENAHFSNPIRILLGNSATRTNNHKDALYALSKYSDKDIEIICPLSYGDKKYALEIDGYGKKLFGNKYKSLFEYMSPSEYAHLLNSVKVAVFNHNRQQGTGNIEILSYLGKKVFIRSDTTTWEHYVVRDKCSFFDSCSINELSFDEFITFSNEDRESNLQYFKKIWDENYIKSLWDDVIKYERNEK